MLSKYIIFFAINLLGLSSGLPVFTEIGQGKPAVVYIRFHEPTYHINDGNIDTNVHSIHQKFPYVYIDLLNFYIIQRVEVFNRRNCCGVRLLGGVVRIGRSAEDVMSNIACGEPVTSGEAVDASVVVRECNQAVLARYVSVSLELGIAEFLNLAEIKVIGMIGPNMYENHFYLFVPNATSWPDAKTICERQSATLLTINTEEEKQYVASLLTYDSWIGLNDLAVEGSPSWLTAGNALNYGGNHNADEDCFKLVSNDRTMQTTDCNSELGYICESRCIAYETFLIFAEDKTPSSTYVIRNTLTQSSGACSMECGKIEGCRSFSFNRISIECSLTTSNGQEEELVDATGFDFFVSTSFETKCNFDL